MPFDVKIGDTLYPLVHDPEYIHPPEVHRHLGTDTTSLTPERALRRLLNAVEETQWFDEAGTYVGRNTFGIGIADDDAG